MATAGMVKPKIFPTVGAVAALPTVTISVEELQRQVDMRALRSRKSKTSIEATLMSAFPSSRRVNSWLPRKQPVQALPSKAGGTAVMTTLIIL